MRLVAAAAAAVALVAAPAAAQSSDPGWMRGLGDLMSLEVTSVSRKEQRLAETSAAAYVLTRDDIRRSGLRTVAELLRLVPGLHVGHIDGNKWAVTARGMNGRYASKLLVMIDGRSVYTPYHAGVIWDAIDVPVHVIERIEVVRGPGASIWGANAVNGVINIITQGDATRRETVVSAGAGSVDFGTVLHTGRAGDRIGYRLFADAAGYRALEQPDGGSAQDDWRQQRAGGSFTAALNGRDSLQGAIRATASESNSLHRLVTAMAPFTTVDRLLPVEASVWSVSAEWARQLTDQGYLKVEGFADGWQRQDELDHERHTYDVAVRHRLGIGGRHDVIWGGGYRQTHETTIGGLTLEVSPAQYVHRLASGFVQDEIGFADRRGHLTLGTKVERHDFSGWSVQPTARGIWRLSPAHSMWAAVSRAMRAPDRLERSVEIPVSAVALETGLSGVTTVQGTDAFEPEWLTAYEAGYRAALTPALTLDLASYYNRYSGLRSVVNGPPSLRTDETTGAPFVHLPLVLSNVAEATSAGGELLATYAPRRFWALTGSYTLFTMKAGLPASVVPDSFEGGAAPRHQGQLRGSASLPGHVDADVSFFATGSIPELNVAAWTRVDTRVAWKPREPIELSLSIQNLLNHQHYEFGGRSSTVVQFSAIPRTAYGAVSWRF